MSTEPSPAHEGGEAPRSDVHDEPSSQQRKHRLSVAAVAAAVLLAGGGGAYWASTAGNGGDQNTPGEDGNPPALALDGLAAHGGGQAGEGQSGIAPGEPNNASTFRASGKLPDGPRSGAVRRPTDGVDRADVAALAKALKVKGSPKKEDGRWTVADSADRKGPVLTVGGEGSAGSWSYTSEGSEGGTACAAPSPLPGSGGQSAPGIGTGASSPCTGIPESGDAEGKPVSEQKAKDAAQPVLDALKLDDAELDAETTAAGVRMVNAAPKVGGLPTYGWDTAFSVDADGELVRAHGNLGQTSKGSEYPVMSARETLKKLNAQRAVPQTSAQRGSVAGSAKDATDAKDPKEAPAGKPQTATVSDARFGLATHYTDGKPVLVPSWIYTVDVPGQGKLDYRVTHPAVQPKFLKPSGGASGPGTERPGKPPKQSPSKGSGSDGSDQAPGAGGSGGGDAKAKAQAVNSYKADGKKLTLTFWGGVCDKYEATAKESGDKVEVTIKPRNPDSKKVCVKIAKRQTAEVELDKALGDRKVVDARDGDALPSK